MCNHSIVVIVINKRVSGCLIFLGNRNEGLLIQVKV